MTPQTPVDARTLAGQLAVVKHIKDQVTAEEKRLKALAIEAFDAKDRKSAVIEDYDIGTVSCTGGNEELAIVDEVSFKDWVVVHRPDLLDYIEVVPDHARQQLLREAMETGALPDGVDLVQKAKSIRVAATQSQKDGFALLWQQTPSVLTNVLQIGAGSG